MYTDAMYSEAKTHKAFTLVELLVTIGIIMILMTITIVSLNIDGQFKTAREAKRSADARVLLDSISQFLIDNQQSEIIPKDGVSRYLSNGSYVPKWSQTSQPAPTPNIDMCSLLIPRYIAQLPIDPLFSDAMGGVIDCNNYHTGYMVTQTAEGRIIVSAPFSEVKPIIAVR